MPRFLHWLQPNDAVIPYVPTDLGSDRSTLAGKVTEKKGYAQVRHVPILGKCTPIGAVKKIDCKLHVYVILTKCPQIEVECSLCGCWSLIKKSRELQKRGGHLNCGNLDAEASAYS